MIIYIFITINIVFAVSEEHINKVDNYCKIEYYNYEGRVRVQCPNCGKHGQCDNEYIGNTGKCICDTGWTGEFCNKCDIEYYGSECQYECLKCKEGDECDSGFNGNGFCRGIFSCDKGFTGENCDKCKDFHRGPECKLCGTEYTCGIYNECVDGINPSNECLCPHEGYKDGLCLYECREGYYGCRCEKCPECINGLCEDTIFGSGKCICEELYYGELCEKYEESRTKSEVSKTKSEARVIIVVIIVVIVVITIFSCRNRWKTMFIK